MCIRDSIKTVVGPDDFGSMTEVVGRRYKRLIDENLPLPQLVVIDGGKGQLSAARTALEELKIENQVAIIGIAKKLEEIYFPGDSIPLHIDKTSESLKLIQQLRNEAHRFAITFHRKKREKATIGSELRNIPGIGEKTTNELLKHFKSVKKIKAATERELSTVIGSAKARVVFEHFAKGTK